MKMPWPFPLLATLLLLAACGDDEGRGGLTAEEERQLDEAAQMLDDNMVEVPADGLVLNEAELQALEAETTAPPNAAAETNGQ